MKFNPTGGFDIPHHMKLFGTQLKKQSSPKFVYRVSPVVNLWTGLTQLLDFLGRWSHSDRLAPLLISPHWSSSTVGSRFSYLAPLLVLLLWSCYYLFFIRFGSSSNWLFLAKHYLYKLYWNCFFFLSMDSLCCTCGMVEILYYALFAYVSTRLFWKKTRF